MQFCCTKNDNGDKPDKNAWAIHNDVVHLHRATVEGDETYVSNPVFERACAALIATGAASHCAVAFLGVCTGPSACAT